MKLIEYAVTLAFLSTFFAVQPACAYLQYSYATDVLPWEYSILNHQEKDYENEYLLEGSHSPAFTFSFAVDENELLSSGLTVHEVKDGDATINPAFFGNYTRNLDVKSTGKVFLNPDGSIYSWNLLFVLPTKVFPDTDAFTKLSKYTLRLWSAGGKKSCNCDRLQLNMDIVTQRQNGWWPVSDEQSNYADASNYENWYIEKTGVPEPQTYAMLLFGLAAIVLFQRKKIQLQRIPVKTNQQGVRRENP